MTNVTKMIISVLDREENIVGKELLVQAISPFPTIFFRRLLSQMHQKVSLCGNGLTGNPGLIPAQSSSQTRESMGKALHSQKYCENLEEEKKSVVLKSSFKYG